MVKLATILVSGYVALAAGQDDASDIVPMNISGSEELPLDLSADVAETQANLRNVASKFGLTLFHYMLWVHMIHFKSFVLDASDSPAALDAHVTFLLKPELLAKVETEYSDRSVPVDLIKRALVGVKIYLANEEGLLAARPKAEVIEHICNQLAPESDLHSIVAEIMATTA